MTLAGAADRAGYVPAGSIEGPLGYLGEAVAAAAAVRTAGRLGVLTVLDEAPARTGDLAAACQLTERGARLLLAALHGLGVVEATGEDTWRAAVPDLPALTRTGDMWTHLDDAVRLGRPLVRGDTPDGAAGFYPDAVGHLGAMVTAVAERAAHLLPPAARVVDAGAGAAPWSLAVAARNPDCVITAIDLPAVLPATRHAIRRAGRERQFRFAEGDIFAVDLPVGSFDLAIAGNLCHLFDETANRRLLGRLGDALAPGGTVAIMDVMPDGGPLPRWARLYELGLMLRTRGGGVHPLTSYLDWLDDAGFESHESHLLADRAQFMLLLARRRA